MRGHKCEGPAARPTPLENTINGGIVGENGAARKQFETLRAEAALAGYEVLALPDGRYLACRWGWCRLHRSLRHLAEFLRRKGVFDDFLHQIGGAA